MSKQRREYILPIHLGLSIYRHSLYVITLGLWIAAPSTPQSASLKEYDGPYPYTVMYRIPLDIKYPSFYIEIAVIIHFLSVIYVRRLPFFRFTCKGPALFS